MSTPDAQGLRVLEKEKARLKRLLPERDLEIDAMQELLAKNGRRFKISRWDRISAGEAAVAAKGLPATSSQPALAAVLGLARTVGW